MKKGMVILREGMKNDLGEDYRFHCLKNKRQSLIMVLIEALQSTVT